jgi:hypothetical protein
MPNLFIEMKILLTFCPVWLQTMILCIYTSQVSGITDVSHCSQPSSDLLIVTTANSCFSSLIHLTHQASECSWQGILAYFLPDLPFILLLWGLPE